MTFFSRDYTGGDMIFNLTAYRIFDEAFHISLHASDSLLHVLAHMS